MAFIHKYSTISKGDTFNQGIIDTWINFKKEAEIMHPNYKEAIPGVSLRRMSAIVKMGLANTIKCSTNNKVDAIVVGTGLGSIHHTELFLSSFINADQSILSPTPFINSVHNTISGEIALHTQNKGYNSTYSHNGLSFEGALLDAMLLTKEGGNVIIGGIDESIPILDDLLTKMKSKNLFSSGSSFFNLSPNKKHSLAEVTNCIITKEKQLLSLINTELNPEEDFIISGSSTCNKPENTNAFNYSKYSGIYMTNSSFGLQLAVEILTSLGTNKLDGYKLPAKLKRVIIINYSSKNDVGVIILKK